MEALGLKSFHAQYLGISAPGNVTAVTFGYGSGLVGITVDERLLFSALHGCGLHDTAEEEGWEEGGGGHCQDEAVGRDFCSGPAPGALRGG